MYLRHVFQKLLLFSSFHFNACLFSAFPDFLLFPYSLVFRCYLKISNSWILCSLTVCLLYKCQLYFPNGYDSLRFEPKHCNEKQQYCSVFIAFLLFFSFFFFVSMICSLIARWPWMCSGGNHYRVLLPTLIHSHSVYARYFSLIQAYMLAKYSVRWKYFLFRRTLICESENYERKKWFRTHNKIFFLRAKCLCCGFMLRFLNSH